MKEILYFMMPGCPYCRRAEAWVSELSRENPEYGKIPMRVIDETRESALANTYEYWYVPTYYVGGVKLHEGAASKEKIKQVLDAALG